MTEAEAASTSEILVDTFYFEWLHILEDHYLWPCLCCQVVGCSYTDWHWLFIVFEH